MHAVFSLSTFRDRKVFVITQHLGFVSETSPDSSEDLWSGKIKRKIVCYLFLSQHFWKQQAGWRMTKPDDQMTCSKVG